MDIKVLLERYTSLKTELDVVINICLRGDIIAFLCEK